MTVSWNVLDSDVVHGDVVQCFTGVQFNHMVKTNYEKGTDSGTCS